MYAIVMHVYMDYWEDILLHLYFFKVQLFWRAFSLQTIGGLIMTRFLCLTFLKVVDVEDPIILPFFD
jgi:succinate dehydrogenase/fumarate reductase cytochrome b subunit